MTAENFLSNERESTLENLHTMRGDWKMSKQIHDYVQEGVLTSQIYERSVIL